MGGVHRVSALMISDGSGQSRLSDVGASLVPLDAVAVAAAAAAYLDCPLFTLLHTAPADVALLREYPVPAAAPFEREPPPAPRARLLPMLFAD